MVKQHIENIIALIERIKKTILVMVFFSLSNFLFAGVELEKDTIIIDGITIEIQVVEEVLEDSQSLGLEEDSMTKEKKPLSLTVSFNQGISFNSVEASDTYTSLDEFIESNPVTGKYSSVSVRAIVLDRNRFSVSAGLNYTSWSQDYFRLNDQLDDSLNDFYSPFKGEFCQVTLIRTEFGEERDTLALTIISDEYRQSYLELSLGLNYNLLNPKKKSSLRLGALLIPGLLIGSNNSTISTLKGKELIEHSTSDLNESTVNLSVQGGVSFEIPLSSNVGFFVQSGYRKNLSNIFKKDTPLKVSRNAVFLGLGAKFIF
ncbi:MAG TPA: hypothetical protein DHU89_09190 [Flavobacteriales bacterium]|nr:hypothetical protein [Flavobacteriales bacterium]